MPRKKLTACGAKEWLKARGIKFNKDFHQLSLNEKELVLDAARRANYRKSKSAPGSRSRMYFSYLKRKKSC
jgi:hypothetical protein